MEKQEKFALIIGLIALIAMSFFIGQKIPAKTQIEYAITNDGKTLPLIHVRANAIRHPDYVEVEYDGNVYSTWIDANSEIQTGDLIWVAFSLYEGNLELVAIEGQYE